MKRTPSSLSERTKNLTPTPNVPNSSHSQSTEATRRKSQRGSFQPDETAATDLFLPYPFSALRYHPHTVPPPFPMFSGFQASKIVPTLLLASHASTTSANTATPGSHYDHSVSGSLKNHPCVVLQYEDSWQATEGGYWKVLLVARSRSVYCDALHTLRRPGTVRRAGENAINHRGQLSGDPIAIAFTPSTPS